MSDDFQAPPPSYTDVTNKSAYPVSSERATVYTAPQQMYTAPQQMYAAPQQEYPGQMKYPTVNPTIPVAYGVQVVPLGTFTKNPIQCTCAHCRSMIITRVEQSNGLLAWLLCLLLLLFGCWLGCCLIPFCISDLQNVQHYCPNCNAFIGEYRPL